MDQIEIIVDDREQKVIPYFNGITMPPNMTFKVSRVNHGDYSVLYKDYILFIIERKTWTDLAASLRDGRKENNKKLFKIRQATGCHLIYLIEGNPIPSSTTKFGRVPYKALRSHLDHLAFRDGVHMVYSKNNKNTVERIIELVKNYLTITPSPLIEIDKLVEQTQNNGECKTGGGIDKLKEKIPITANTIIYKIWCCVPNITEKTACLFINKGYHISDLILGNIKKEEIYTMKYPNGYVIGKRSEKIWTSTRPNDTNPKNPVFIKMLTQLNGITKKTAEIILNKISFKKILNGGVSIDEIKEIHKSPEGRKVGPKASGEIIRWFSKSESSIILSEPSEDTSIISSISAVDNSLAYGDVSK
jgi:ERCC4-type nuclease